MGLDATVRCRCFEEGKLKPGPIPYEDLYIDEEGYLSSSMLDAAHEKYDYRRFQARYGNLEREFEEWSNNCCEHEFGDYCSERVGNIAGCAHFQSLVKESGGELAFPLLSNLLPIGNEGIYPAEKAVETLAELDRFIAKINQIEEWVLCAEGSDEEIWTSTEGSSFTWMFGPFDRVGMNGGKVFFCHYGHCCIETTHFKQIPIGDPDNNGYQKMAIECLDTGEHTMTFDSVGPPDSPKEEREFYVTNKHAPFLYEGKYWTAERIRGLLEASIETGNPIRWC